MDILEILGIESRIKQAEKESPQERYARVVFPLDNPEYIGTDIWVPIDGDYLAKIKYDGTAAGCWFKFGNKRSSIIYAAEFRKRHTPFVMFKGIHLSNPVSQPGKEFVVFVGGAFAGEIEPSTGAKVGLTDADGADMTPVKDARFKAHTFAHLKPTTMGAANTAQALLAGTKVRWAIVHFLSKIALIGDSDVTRGGGAADGQKYAEGAYLTLEHVDLGDVYIINFTVGEACIYTINYIKEAV
jgi:hypothetical protein